jgi:uncharacterized LabA/DUF88 family protein
MVLNIPPKRREAAAASPVAVVEQPQENEQPPATPATEEPRKRTRRTTTTATAAAAGEAAPRAPRTRRTAAQKAAEAAELEQAARANAEDTSAEAEGHTVRSDEMPAPEALAPVTDPGEAMSLPETDSAETAEAIAEGDAATGEQPQEGGRRRSRSRGGRGRRGRGDRTDDAAEREAIAEFDATSAGEYEAPAAREEPNGRGDLRSLTRLVEQQSRQIEQLTRATQDLTRRAPNGGVAAGAPGQAKTARVGVFVDTANIELATDRLRVRFDWGKVLRMLLKDRQLVRAVAYSPIHDDPAVSIETQRFVEPFLDRGFKIVTKAFRRFQDGSIKANLDIELALDVVAMLDRLDVVILVSGDGDFQRLVEMAQSRGVRVEVAAVGASTAGNLRHAADEYVDLGTRARDLRS